MAFEYSTIRYLTGVTTPGLVVGGPLTLGPNEYELYYLFPLNEEQDTLALLQRALTVAGLVLVLLLAAIAWLVTRQVVDPVREAARTAERFSAGRLEERMAVVGEDDLARLARSFNHMAGSLQAQIRQLEDLSRVQRRFVSDVSHELRTPLTTITGYTELARRRPDDPQTVRTALGKVEEESARMTALVEDLLLLARLDAGRPLERRPVDLSRLLVEAVSDARVVSPDHRWKLAVPEDSIEVEGDARRLHQVVTNLLANARKYTPAGTTVTVTARPHGFSVHDDGPGFPPGLADHAFERFARGDIARSRGSEGGAGLGLSLVHAIVTAHGGSVRLSSRPGSTEVAVDLPR
jgi:two-component system OmpR family sensor kinase